MKKSTLGQQLYDTKEEHSKLVGSPIEAGEFVNEAGKSYMKGLFKAIEEHRRFNRAKLWFMVKIEKEFWNARVIKISIGAMDKPLSYFHQSMDHWVYDYTNDELKLLWSLPHRVEMDNFIKDPEKYSPDLIGWIKGYLKQDNVNLNDESKVRL